MASRLITLSSLLLAFGFSGVLATECGASNSLTGTNCSSKCGVDYAGGDYKSLKVANFAACATACYSDSLCVDAQYHKPTSYCYLKNKLTSPSTNANVDTIICRPPPTTTTTTKTTMVTSTTSKTTTTTAASAPTCPAEDGLTVSGSGTCGCSYKITCDIYTVGGREASDVITTAATEAQCRTMCDNYSNCNNYNYNYGTKECQLFDGFEDYQPSATGWVNGQLVQGTESCKTNRTSCPQLPGTCNEGYFSGAGTCQCQYHEFCTGSTFGKVLSTTTVPDVETCRKRCDTYSNCEGYRLDLSNNACTIFAFDNNQNYIGPVGKGFRVGFEEDSSSYPNCRKSCSAYPAAKLRFA